MARLILDYYCGKDLYSDGFVEDRILDEIRNGHDLDPEKETVDSDDSYAILYHLSKMRENILNWYPFKKGCHVLEIGSGCGAITGLLCLKAGFVTSVELSLKRAKINYERHKAISNLEIVVGNFNDLEARGVYDYVILNGVLEYAQSFGQGENPFENLLQRVRTHLKKSGILLIAIENRLGLKYFAGAPEDHTDQCFWGIRDYPNDDTVRTFSKSELQELLYQSGYSCQKFYYPYPDYKFPKEIFTDDNINSGDYGKPGTYIEKWNHYLFDIKKVANSLATEKVMDKFANSFLVEAGSVSGKKSQIIYAKLNSDRKAEFATGTIIYKNCLGKKVVKKWPLTSCAAGHIFRTNQNDHSNKYNLKGTYNHQEHSIIYPYLCGTTLCNYVKRIPLPLRAEVLIEKANEIVSKMTEKEQEKDDFYTEQFQNVFGQKRINGKQNCIYRPNLDLILDNVFMIGHSYRIIDCEWYFNGWVPRKLIVWRILNEMYHQDQELNAQIDFDVLLMGGGISKEEDQCFREWSNHFARDFVQLTYIKKVQRSSELLNITDYLHGIKRSTTNLYIDSGKGFSESEKLWNPLTLNDSGYFETVFSLSAWEEIGGIRWDPLELEIIICQDLHFFLDDREVSFRALNAEKEVPGLFITLDPQYLYTAPPAKYKELRITGMILQMNDPKNLIDVYEKEIKSKLGGN